MENEITIRVQCDPAEGLRLAVYTTDANGLTVEHVDISTDGEVNLVWSNCVRGTAK